VEPHLEEDIAASLCPIFSRIIPEFDQQQLMKMADDVESLCLLVNHKRAVEQEFVSGLQTTHLSS
jgi:hypothetical protein